MPVLEPYPDEELPELPVPVLAPYPEELPVLAPVLGLEELLVAVDTELDDLTTSEPDEERAYQCAVG